MNIGNVFSAVFLSKSMCVSLPEQPRPHLKNPFDAIALLSHACMLAVGFRLIGLGEDHKLEIPSDDAAHNKSLPTLPNEWNATSSSNYAFRYAHSQSSLQYLIKISRLGGKAVINGLGIGDDKVYTVDFLIKDFLSESAFPYTLPPNMNDDEDHNQQIESIQTVFISAGRIADLASVFKLQIIQKFAPGLQKEGYKESAHAASQATTTSRQQPNPDRDQPPRHPSADIQDNPFAPPFAQPRAIHDPLIGPPPRPFPAGDFPPPGFEDEYDLNRPQLGGGGRRPVNIGERDLYPQGLGPHDPLRSGGFGPTGGFGGGGMHPTFDDPIFGGGGGASGIGGFDGRAPPGARYDPVGPGDGPPYLHGGPRFPGSGGGGMDRGRGQGGGGDFMGGRPPNPFGGFGGDDFI